MLTQDSESSARSLSETPPPADPAASAGGGTTSAYRAVISRLRGGLIDRLFIFTEVEASVYHAHAVQTSEGWTLTSSFGQGGFKGAKTMRANRNRATTETLNKDLVMPGQTVLLQISDHGMLRIGRPAMSDRPSYKAQVCSLRPRPYREIGLLDMLGAGVIRAHDLETGQDHFRHPALPSNEPSMRTAADALRDWMTRAMPDMGRSNPWVWSVVFQLDPAERVPVVTPFSGRLRFG